MRKILILLILGIGLIIIARMPVKQTSPAFSQIIREMGYDDVSETPFEVTEIKIPETFNKVWENYNGLLKESGYDLAFYKGKTCKRYTYLLPMQNARANILVYKGEIIGGDISGITLDGIMIPIKKKD